jgi:hypothetical protein
VETINLKMGIHTRLTDEVEAWKIKRTFEMVREMGATWVVEYFPWAYIEPEPDQYRWEHADLVVNHARHQGLRVIARLGFVPEWARPDPNELTTTFTYLDEEAFPAFADFVAKFVSHFQGQVDYIVVWNEPNLSLEWGYRPVDPEAYTHVLQHVYTRAKAANPDVLVLGGALAPSAAPEGDPQGLSDLLYLERMYEAGAGAYFDALAVHAYGWRLPPDDPPDPDRVNLRRVELLRQMMEEHGDAGKPVFITEAGWNDHPRWTKAVRPAQRVRYTIMAYQKALTDWPWCSALVIWAFRFPRPTNTFQDYFSLVTADFVPKPIYTAIQEYARGGRP